MTACKTKAFTKMSRFSELNGIGPLFWCIVSIHSIYTYNVFVIYRTHHLIVPTQRMASTRYDKPTNILTFMYV